MTCAQAVTVHTQKHCKQSNSGHLRSAGRAATSAPGCAGRRWTARSQTPAADQRAQSSRMARRSPWSHFMFICSVRERGPDYVGAQRMQRSLLRACWLRCVPMWAQCHQGRARARARVSSACPPPHQLTRSLQYCSMCGLSLHLLLTYTVARLPPSCPMPVFIQPCEK